MSCPMVTAQRFVRSSISRWSSCRGRGLLLDTVSISSRRCASAVSDDPILQVLTGDVSDELFAAMLGGAHIGHSNPIDKSAVTDAQELETLARCESIDTSDGDIFLVPSPPDPSQPGAPMGMPIKSALPDPEPRLAIMCSPSGYLAQQDALYLSSPTPETSRLPLPPAKLSSCVMVVFAANDLRVHDNYALALAAARAEAAGGIPVVAVTVLDYRTFAQPSTVGGFFRQSPTRAHFLLDTIAALREQLEGKLRVPLLVRCGRPEEHIPRLAFECGATDVFLSTQYAPHEKCVHDAIMRALRCGEYVSRDSNTGGITVHSASSGPWPVPHSVWQTTLVHYDDLPVPVAAMREGERWYHDDVTVAPIRPTLPFDRCVARLAGLSPCNELLPTSDERRGAVEPPAFRGRLPTLMELGYGSAEAFAVEDIIATESSHPPGEDAAVARVDEWLSGGGATSLLRYGRPRRTNTKMYSQHLSRLSPYLSVGALSPRRLYEMLRMHANENLRDGFVQSQCREGILRLSRRDYWHWMGLRYGRRLFYSYGPTPEQTDDVADWRHDWKIVQKWCTGLTGIPFADAAMRELVATGFVAHEGRQALAWLLTRGYGQDWRLGAEWLERCSLDYDPFVCYGNFAYCGELIRDDFGEPVRTLQYLAHHHDQSGIYVKKWLPQLSKIPPVYIHRPHVLTPRMQAMHGVRLGKNYPYPLKLWDGAQYVLGSEELTAYFDGTGEWQNKARNGEGGIGYAEALRHGVGNMNVDEWNLAVSHEYIACRPWACRLPMSAFESNTDFDSRDVQLVRVERREGAVGTTARVAIA